MKLLMALEHPQNKPSQIILQDGDIVSVRPKWQVFVGWGGKYTADVDVWRPFNSHRAFEGMQINKGYATAMSHPHPIIQVLVGDSVIRLKPRHQYRIRGDSCDLIAELVNERWLPVAVAA